MNIQLNNKVTGIMIKRNGVWQEIKWEQLYNYSTELVITLKLDNAITITATNQVVM